jgi:hypothetical protein
MNHAPENEIAARLAGALFRLRRIAQFLAQAHHHAARLADTAATIGNTARYTALRQALEKTDALRRTIHQALLRQAASSKEAPDKLP